MNEFQKARLKLTFFYILTSALMLFVFSLAAINAENTAFDKIQQVLGDPKRRPALTNLLERRLNAFEADFRARLFYFDIALLLLAAIASYFLSGKTLEPIAKMVKGQEEFSADVSHELRTPLTTINMEVEALKRTEKKLPSSIVSALGNIQEEVIKMRQLADGLLTLVRPQDAKQTEEVEITSLAEKTVNKMQPQATTNKVRIEFSGNEKIPVLGNEHQLEQLLVILLDNAIKYSPKKSFVDVVLKISGNEVVLEVSDQGEGILEKDLPLIFNRFYRASNQKHKGSGLGLSIAQKIVENHKGKISVKSEVNKGTTFTVRLPLNS